MDTAIGELLDIFSLDTTAKTPNESQKKELENNN